MFYLRAYRETDGIEPLNDGVIRFVASTEGIKRDGRELKLEDWRLDNYLRNPVVLWAHGYMGERPPIGRAQVMIDPGRRALIADVTFDRDDPFAQEIERKIRAGFLNAVSVGWQDVEVEENGKKRTVHDLLDISVVPVPADPDALTLQQRQALQVLSYEINRILERPEHGRPYDIFEEDGKYCVYKMNPDTGEKEQKLGCHDTKEKAQAQIQAVAIATHEDADGRQAIWITTEQMEQLCPDCAREMRRRGFTRINVRQMPPHLLEGLCKSLGDDPGLFTRCMEKDFGEFDPGDKEAFCAWLHHECTGQWPAERDGGVGSHAVWSGVASAMLALYQYPTALEEDTRRYIYNQLERIYRRLGRTAPEYRSAAELIWLTDQERRGLFLEGEARAGAVLSARNRSDLEQAIQLIQGVLDRAKPPENGAEDENDYEILQRLQRILQEVSK